MTVSLKDAMSRVPAKRRQKIEAHAAELIGEEMTLRDLRKARELTQEKMAKLLDVKQESISNLEKRSDLLLSTLRGYVEAMGGDLALLVRFPNRPPVQICTIGPVRGPTRKTARARKPKPNGRRIGAKVVQPAGRSRKQPS